VVQTDGAVVGAGRWGGVTGADKAADSDRLAGHECVAPSVSGRST
jgi:hypothetical protein